VRPWSRCNSSAAPSVVQSVHSEAESIEQISSSSEEIRPVRGGFSAYVKAVAGKGSAMSVPSPAAQPSRPVLPVASVPVVVIADSDDEEDAAAAQETIQHFESDVTVSVDDQFETEEKLRCGGSASQSSNPNLSSMDSKTVTEQIGVSLGSSFRPGFLAGSSGEQGEGQEGHEAQGQEERRQPEIPCSVANRLSEDFRKADAGEGGLCQSGTRNGVPVSASSLTDPAPAFRRSEGTPGHLPAGTHERELQEGQSPHSHGEFDTQIPLEAINRDFPNLHSNDHSSFNANSVTSPMTRLHPVPGPSGTRPAGIGSCGEPAERRQTEDRASGPHPADPRQALEPEHVGGGSAMAANAGSNMAGVRVLPGSTPKTEPRAPMGAVTQETAATGGRESPGSNIDASSVEPRAGGCGQLEGIVLVPAGAAPPTRMSFSSGGSPLSPRGDTRPTEFLSPSDFCTAGDPPQGIRPIQPTRDFWWSKRVKKCHGRRADWHRGSAAEGSQP